MWEPLAEVLKRNEGGPGTAYCLAVLKAAGVEARSRPSPLVGHSTLLIRPGTGREATRVLKAGPLPWLGSYRRICSY
jgi:hypothetical protein